MEHVELEYGAVDSVAIWALHRIPDRSPGSEPTGRCLDGFFRGQFPKHLSGNRPLPGRNASDCYIQRSLSRTRTVALGIRHAAAADSGDSAWESANSRSLELGISIDKSHIDPRAATAVPRGCAPFVHAGIHRSI